MFSFIHSHSFFFIVFSTICLCSDIIAAPLLNKNPYNQFIESLMEKNCTMPEEIELPFSTSDRSNFSYLSDPLKECQTSHATEKNDEVWFLCNEIFEVLQNITCIEYIAPVPKIKKTPLSQNICNDFQAMHDVFPKGDNYLSGKLVDGILCKVLCSGEHELLCKTVLWSYDVQVKIKTALQNSEKENEKEKIDGEGDAASQMPLQNSEKENEKGKIAEGAATKMYTPSIKVNLVGGKLNSDEEETPNKMAAKKVNVDDTHSESKKNSIDSSDLKKSEIPEASFVNVREQTIDKTVTPINNSQTVTNAKTTSESENSKVSVALKNEYDTDNQKHMNDDGLSSVELNETPPAKDNNEQNLDSKDKDFNQNPESNDLHQNEINVSANPGGVDVVKIIPVSPFTNSNSLTSKTSNIKDKIGKNISSTKSPDTEKSVIDAGAIEENHKSGNSLPQDNEENELSNVNIEEKEKESKDNKQADLKTEDEKPETPKLIDFETPLSSSNKDLKEFETTTVQMLPDEDVEHQEDKEPEQFNDTENEGDYPKSEYDNSFNPPLKNKVTSVKSSIAEDSDQMSNNYEMFINTRNNIGQHVPDDIQMIPSFPEQEDSHFFFYFLSIVVILMAGYLIFHNKQKIIALIVEGRHERRRRSHGAGYKKLETK